MKEGQESIVALALDALMGRFQVMAGQFPSSARKSSLLGEHAVKKE
jgi:hypothetical protein